MTSGEMIFAMFIAFMAGIFAGRLSTFWRLKKADELVENAGELLDKAKIVRDQIEEYTKEYKDAHKQ